MKMHILLLGLAAALLMRFTPCALSAESSVISTEEYEVYEALMTEFNAQDPDLKHFLMDKTIQSGSPDPVINQAVQELSSKTYTISPPAESMLRPFLITEEAYKNIAEKHVVVSFSRVAFLEDGRAALGFDYLICAPGRYCTGSSSLRLLTKENGRWQVTGHAGHGFQY